MGAHASPRARIIARFAARQDIPKRAGCQMRDVRAGVLFTSAWCLALVQPANRSPTWSMALQTPNGPKTHAPGDLRVVTDDGDRSSVGVPSR